MIGFVHLTFCNSTCYTLTAVNQWLLHRGKCLMLSPRLHCPCGRSRVSWPVCRYTSSLFLLSSSVKSPRGAFQFRTSPTSPNSSPTEMKTLSFTRPSFESRSRPYGNTELPCPGRSADGFTSRAANTRNLHLSPSARPWSSLCSVRAYARSSSCRRKLGGRGTSERSGARTFWNTRSRQARRA